MRESGQYFWCATNALSKKWIVFSVLSNQPVVLEVLEPKPTNASVGHPPPLHPIGNVGNLLNNAKSNGNSSTEEIKAEEMAVILPLPKKDCSAPEQKPKPTMIPTPPVERRPKKQSRKTPHETLLDSGFLSSSLEAEQERTKQIFSNKEVTLTKVFNKDKGSKLKTHNLPDIELIETSKCATAAIKDNTAASCTEEVNTLEFDPTFDVFKALMWKDGIGSLPGSNLKVLVLPFSI